MVEKNVTVKEETAKVLNQRLKKSGMSPQVQYVKEKRNANHENKGLRIYTHRIAHCNRRHINTCKFIVALR